MPEQLLPTHLVAGAVSALCEGITELSLNNSGHPSDNFSVQVFLAMTREILALLSQQPVASPELPFPVTQLGAPKPAPSSGEKL